jgi:hypothetical protein
VFCSNNHKTYEANFSVFTRSSFILLTVDLKRRRKEKRRRTAKLIFLWLLRQQYMFSIIVIGSYFILKWCKVIFSCFVMRAELFRFSLCECGMLSNPTLWSCDLSLLMCQRNLFFGWLCCEIIKGLVMNGWKSWYCSKVNRREAIKISFFWNAAGIMAITL